MIGITFSPLSWMGGRIPFAVCSVLNEDGAHKTTKRRSKATAIGGVMDKTLPERLREVGNRIIVGGYPSINCKLSCLVSGKKRNDDLCGTRYCYHPCVSDTLYAIADEIEHDYVRIPEFKYDKVEESFREWWNAAVENRVATSVSLVNPIIDECGWAEYPYLMGYDAVKDIRVRFELKPGKTGEDTDTLEKIEQDAGLSIDRYCKAHTTVQYSHEAVTLDLLRRQRKVLERDGE